MLLEEIVWTSDNQWSFLEVNMRSFSTNEVGPIDVKVSSWLYFVEFD